MEAIGSGELCHATKKPSHASVKSRVKYPPKSSLNSALLSAHAKFRKDLETKMIANDSSMEKPIAPRPMPTRGKEVNICVRHLDVRKSYSNRVLCGSFCVKPYLDIEQITVPTINTLLQDEEGRIVRVKIRNAASAQCSWHAMEIAYPIGMKVIIRNPSFKRCPDGGAAIHVTNVLQDIQVMVQNDRASEWEQLLHPSQFTEILSTLRSLEQEGLAFFENKINNQAMKSYARCAATCVDQMARLGDRAETLIREGKSTVEELEIWVRPILNELARIGIKAFHKKAEIFMRVGNYEQAIKEADNALKVDPAHTPSLYCKGLVFQALGLHQQAADCLGAVSALTPEDSIAFGKFRYCRDHARTSLHDLRLANFVLSGVLLPERPFDEFVGPVEIQRSKMSCAGRGLFLKEDVLTGQLLLVSTLIAGVRVYRSFTTLTSTSARIPKDIQDELVNDLSTFIMRCDESRRTRHLQISSLQYGNSLSHLMQVPPMNLFRVRCSEDNDPDQDGASTDSVHTKECMEGIIKHNTIHEEVVGKTCDEPMQVHKIDQWGIWTLPSFINHSCAPNCGRRWVGDSMFIRAERDLPKGEEITVSYFDIFHPLKSREASAQEWGFQCACSRCNFERSLKDGKNTSKAYNKLETANIHLNSELKVLWKNNLRHEDQWVGLISFPSPKVKLRAVRLLYDMLTNTDKVEREIHSWGINDDFQAMYIRGSFIDFYIARYVVCLLLPKDQHVEEVVKTMALENFTDENEQLGSLASLIDIFRFVHPSDPLTLEYCANFLRSILTDCDKENPDFKAAEENILQVYRAQYGRLEKTVLLNLLDLDVAE